METKTIVMCVVALLLGILMADMLQNVCGCKDIVEGQGNDECWDGDMYTFDKCCADVATFSSVCAAPGYTHDSCCPPTDTGPDGAGPDVAGPDGAGPDESPTPSTDQVVCGYIFTPCGTGEEECEDGKKFLKEILVPNERCTVMKQDFSLPACKSGNGRAQGRWGWSWDGDGDGAGGGLCVKWAAQTPGPSPTPPSPGPGPISSSSPIPVPSPTPTGPDPGAAPAKPNPNSLKCWGDGSIYAHERCCEGDAGDVDCWGGKISYDYCCGSGIDPPTAPQTTSGNCTGRYRLTFEHGAPIIDLDHRIEP